MAQRCNIEDIIEYSEGRLSLESENSLKEHIKSCNACKRAFYMFSFADGFIKSPFHAGDSVAKNIMDSIDRNRYKNKNFSYLLIEQLYKIRPMLKLTACVLALCILFASIIIYKSTLKEPEGNNTAAYSTSTQGNANDKYTAIPSNSKIESISIDDLRKNPHFSADEYEFEELSSPVKTTELVAINEAKTIVGARSCNDAKKITAISLRLTNKKHPYIAGSSVVLKDYPVWIVTFYNLHLTISGGAKHIQGVQKSKESKEIIADTNVFIDANTGKYLESISYSVFNQYDAIHKVLELHPESGFPDNPGKVRGILEVGGRPPGISIPAEFETKVEKENEWVYIITLTQCWDAKDLRGPNSKGSALFYYWKYRVTIDGAVEIDSGGDNTCLIM